MCKIYGGSFLKSQGELEGQFENLLTSLKMVSLPFTGNKWPAPLYMSQDQDLFIFKFIHYLPVAICITTPEGYPYVKISPYR